MFEAAGEGCVCVCVCVCVWASDFLMYRMYWQLDKLQVGQEPSMFASVHGIGGISESPNYRENVYTSQ